jgi:hypothetical protein
MTCVYFVFFLLVSGIYFNEYRPFLKPGPLNKTLDFKLFIHGTNQCALDTDLAAHHTGTRFVRDRRKLDVCTQRKTTSEQHTIFNHI